MFLESITYSVQFRSTNSLPNRSRQAPSLVMSAAGSSVARGPFICKEIGDGDGEYNPYNGNDDH